MTNSAANQSEENGSTKTDSTSENDAMEGAASGDDEKAISDSPQETCHKTPFGATSNKDEKTMYVLPLKTCLQPLKQTQKVDKPTRLTGVQNDDDCRILNDSIDTVLNDTKETNSQSFEYGPTGNLLTFPNRNYDQVNSWNHENTMPGFPDFNNNDPDFVSLEVNDVRMDANERSASLGNIFRLANSESPRTFPQNTTSITSNPEKTYEMEVVGSAASFNPYDSSIDIGDEVNDSVEGRTRGVNKKVETQQGNNGNEKSCSVFNHHPYSTDIKCGKDSTNKDPLPEENIHESNGMAFTAIDQCQLDSICGENFRKENLKSRNGNAKFDTKWNNSSSKGQLDAQNVEHEAEFSGDIGGDEATSASRLEVEDKGSQPQATNYGIFNRRVRVYGESSLFQSSVKGPNQRHCKFSWITFFNNKIHFEDTFPENLKEYEWYDDMGPVSRAQDTSDNMGDYEKVTEISVSDEEEKIMLGEKNSASVQMETIEGSCPPGTLPVETVIQATTTLRSVVKRVTVSKRIFDEVEIPRGDDAVIKSSDVGTTASETIVTSTTTMSGNQSVVTSSFNVTTTGNNTSVQRVSNVLPQPPVNALFRGASAQRPTETTRRWDRNSPNGATYGRQPMAYPLDGAGARNPRQYTRSQNDVRGSNLYRTQYQTSPGAQHGDNSTTGIHRMGSRHYRGEGYNRHKCGPTASRNKATVNASSREASNGNQTVARQRKGRSKTDVVNASSGGEATQTPSSLPSTGRRIPVHTSFGSTSKSQFEISQRSDYEPSHGASRNPQSTGSNTSDRKTADGHSEADASPPAEQRDRHTPVYTAEGSHIESLIGYGQRERHCSSIGERRNRQLVEITPTEETYTGSQAIPQMPSGRIAITSHSVVHTAPHANVAGNQAAEYGTASATSITSQVSEVSLAESQLPPITTVTSRQSSVFSPVNATSRKKKQNSVSSQAQSQSVKKVPSDKNETRKSVTKHLPSSAKSHNEVHKRSVSKATSSHAKEYCAVNTSGVKHQMLANSPTDRQIVTQTPSGDCQTRSHNLDDTEPITNQIAEHTSDTTVANGQTAVFSTISATAVTNQIALDSSAETEAVTQAGERHTTANSFNVGVSIIHQTPSPETSHIAPDNRNTPSGATGACAQATECSVVTATAATNQTENDSSLAESQIANHQPVEDRSGSNARHISKYSSSTGACSDSNCAGHNSRLDDQRDRVTITNQVTTQNVRSGPFIQTQPVILGASFQSQPVGFVQQHPPSIQNAAPSVIRDQRPVHHHFQSLTPSNWPQGYSQYNSGAFIPQPAVQAPFPVANIQSQVPAHDAYGAGYIPNQNIITIPYAQYQQTNLALSGYGAPVSTQPAAAPNFQTTEHPSNVVLYENEYGTYVPYYFPPANMIQTENHTLPYPFMPSNLTPIEHQPGANLLFHVPNGVQQTENQNVAYSEHSATQAAFQTTVPSSYISAADVVGVSNSIVIATTNHTEVHSSSLSTVLASNKGSSSTLTEAIESREAEITGANIVPTTHCDNCHARGLVCAIPSVSPTFGTPVGTAARSPTRNLSPANGTSDQNQTLIPDSSSTSSETQSVVFSSTTVTEITTSTTRTENVLPVAAQVSEISVTAEGSTVITHSTPADPVSQTRAHSSPSISLTLNRNKIYYVLSPDKVKDLLSKDFDRAAIRHGALVVPLDSISALSSCAIQNGTVGRAISNDTTEQRFQAFNEDQVNLQASSCQADDQNSLSENNSFDGAVRQNQAKTTRSELTSGNNSVDGAVLHNQAEGTRSELSNREHIVEATNEDQVSFQTQLSPFIPSQSSFDGAAIQNQTEATISELTNRVPTIEAANDQVSFQTQSCPFIPSQSSFDGAVLQNQAEGTGPVSHNEDPTIEVPNRDLTILQTPLSTFNNQNSNQAQGSFDRAEIPTQTGRTALVPNNGEPTAEVASEDLINFQTQSSSSFIQNPNQARSSVEEVAIQSQPEGIDSNSCNDLPTIEKANRGQNNQQSSTCVSHNTNRYLVQHPLSRAGLRNKPERTSSYGRVLTVGQAKVQKSYSTAAKKGLELDSSNAIRCPSKTRSSTCTATTGDRNATEATAVGHLNQSQLSADNPAIQMPTKKGRNYWWNRKPKTNSDHQQNDRTEADSQQTRNVNGGKLVSERTDKKVPPPKQNQMQGVGSKKDLGTSSDVENAVSKSTQGKQFSAKSQTFPQNKPRRRNVGRKQDHLPPIPENQPGCSIGPGSKKAEENSHSADINDSKPVADDSESIHYKHFDQSEEKEDDHTINYLNSGESKCSDTVYSTDSNSKNSQAEGTNDNKQYHSVDSEHTEDRGPVYSTEYSPKIFERGQTENNEPYSSEDLEHNEDNDVVHSKNSGSKTSGPKQSENNVDPNLKKRCEEQTEQQNVQEREFKTASGKRSSQTEQLTSEKENVHPQQSHKKQPLEKQTPVSAIPHKKLAHPIDSGERGICENQEANGGPKIRNNNNKSINNGAPANSSTVNNSCLTKSQRKRQRKKMNKQCEQSAKSTEKKAEETTFEKKGDGKNIPENQAVKEKAASKITDTSSVQNEIVSSQILPTESQAHTTAESEENCREIVEHEEATTEKKEKRQGNGKGKKEKTGQQTLGNSAAKPSQLKSSVKEENGQPDSTEIDTSQAQANKTEKNGDCNDNEKIGKRVTGQSSSTTNTGGKNRKRKKKANGQEKVGREQTESELKGLVCTHKNSVYFGSKTGKSNTEGAMNLEEMVQAVEDGMKPCLKCFKEAAEEKAQVEAKKKLEADKKAQAEAKKKLEADKKAQAEAKKKLEADKKAQAEAKKKKLEADKKARIEAKKKLDKENAQANSEENQIESSSGGGVSETDTEEPPSTHIPDFNPDIEGSTILTTYMLPWAYLYKDKLIGYDVRAMKTPKTKEDIQERQELNNRYRWFLEAAMHFVNRNQPVGYVWEFIQFLPSGVRYFNEVLEYRCQQLSETIAERSQQASQSSTDATNINHETRSVADRTKHLREANGQNNSENSSQVSFKNEALSPVTIPSPNRDPNLTEQLDNSRVTTRSPFIETNGQGSEEIRNNVPQLILPKIIITDYDASLSTATASSHFVDPNLTESLDNSRITEGVTRAAFAKANAPNEEEVRNNSTQWIIPEIVVTDFDVNQSTALTSCPDGKLGTTDSSSESRISDSRPTTVPDIQITHASDSDEEDCFDLDISLDPPPSYEEIVYGIVSDIGRDLLRCCCGGAHPKEPIKDTFPEEEKKSKKNDETKKSQAVEILPNGVDYDEEDEIVDLPDEEGEMIDLQDEEREIVDLYEEFNKKYGITENNGQQNEKKLLPTQFLPSQRCRRYPMVPNERLASFVEAFAWRRTSAPEQSTDFRTSSSGIETDSRMANDVARLLIDGFNTPNITASETPHDLPVRTRLFRRVNPFVGTDSRVSVDESTTHNVQENHETNSESRVAKDHNENNTTGTPSYHAEQPNTSSAPQDSNGSIPPAAVHQADTANTPSKPIYTNSTSFSALPRTDASNVLGQSCPFRMIQRNQGTGLSLFGERCMYTLMDKDNTRTELIDNEKMFYPPNKWEAQDACIYCRNFSMVDDLKCCLKCREGITLWSWLSEMAHTEWTSSEDDVYLTAVDEEDNEGDGKKKKRKRKRRKRKKNKKDDDVNGKEEKIDEKKIDDHGKANQANGHCSYKTGQRSVNEVDQKTKTELKNQNQRENPNQSGNPKERGNPDQRENLDRREHPSQRASENANGAAALIRQANNVTMKRERKIIRILCGKTVAEPQPPRASFVREYIPSQRRIPPIRPRIGHGMSRCMTCGLRIENLRICALCMSISYCSTICTATDYNYHWVDCKFRATWNEAESAIPTWLDDLIKDEGLRLITKFRHVPDLFQYFRGTRRALLAKVGAFIEDSGSACFGIYIQDSISNVVPLMFFVDSDEYHDRDKRYPSKLKSLFFPGRFIVIFFPVWITFDDFTDGLGVTDLRHFFFLPEHMNAPILSYCEEAILCKSNGLH